MTANNFDEWMFGVIGNLAVIGGFVGSIRVGTRVYYQPEGVTCIVTSRNVSQNLLSLLCEQEGCVSDQVSVCEVISLGDVPFEPALLDSNKINWLEIINDLINVLSVNLLQLHQQQLQVLVKKMIQKKLFLPRQAQQQQIIIVRILQFVIY